MKKNTVYTTVLILSLVTIVYNIVEGILSVRFGLDDETLSLFGFGMDSFVEVLSGMAVLHLVLRTRGKPSERDRFEKLSLRVTGIAFFLLAAGLSVTAVLNVLHRTQPIDTVWGIIVASISIVTMTVLMKMKLATGKRLNSDAIIADAHCTRTCIYLSVLLLSSSLLYKLFQIPFIDAAGAAGIAWYAFLEGREAFEKATGKNCGCSCDD